MPSISLKHNSPYSHAEAGPFSLESEDISSSLKVDFNAFSCLPFSHSVRNFDFDLLVVVHFEKERSLFQMDGADIQRQGVGSRLHFVRQFVFDTSISQKIQLLASIHRGNYDFLATVEANCRRGDGNFFALVLDLRVIFTCLKYLKILFDLRLHTSFTASFKRLCINPFQQNSLLNSAKRAPKFHRMDCIFFTFRILPSFGIRHIS
mmetsp:Transcript_16272/g.29181  ORF Transcript_16272/g.29181 Transcript_16272/m.29181 type:complete len:206 (-) Transcript_16272:643-1260(-)